MPPLAHYTFYSLYTLIVMSYVLLFSYNLRIQELHFESFTAEKDYILYLPNLGKNNDHRGIFGSTKKI